MVLTALIASCSSVSQQDIAKINGYWQIEKVVLPDGENKDYQGNTVYDHFELIDGKGMRTKVMPQLDGTFTTNNISEHISVVRDDDRFFLAYATDYATWREEVQ